MSASPPPNEDDPPDPSRTTFLPVREVLEKSRTSLESMRQAVGRLPRSDDRDALACDRLDALQGDLAEALGHYFESTPEPTRKERTQYTVEIPPALESPDAPADVEDAIAWTLTLTRFLRERFQRLGDTAVAESLRETYRDLAELVSGFEKRIARIDEGRHDL